MSKKLSAPVKTASAGRLPHPEPVVIDDRKWFKSHGIDIDKRAAEAKAGKGKTLTADTPNGTDYPPKPEPVVIDDREWFKSQGIDIDKRAAEAKARDKKKAKSLKPDKPDGTSKKSKTKAGKKTASKSKAGKSKTKRALPEVDVVQPSDDMEFQA